MVSVAASSFEGNTAEDQGGGIDSSSDGAFTVTDSQVSGNHAVRGGGLSSNSDADHTVENTTISGNAASAEGGGVVVLDPVMLASSTIADNTAPIGGGIQKLGDSRLLLRNTIVADNPGGNCGYEPGTLPTESEGGNLDSEVSCGFTHPADISGADPLLEPLTNNGGSTETHALDSASPAIDEAVSSACPASDQRGITRPQSDGCDIGSYEFDGVVPTPTCADRGTRLVPAAADSWVDQSDPDKNFGDDAGLYVRSGPAADARALMRFDLPTLPSGCQVLAATLRLNATGGTSERALEAVGLASSWEGREVTWSTQPAATGPAATTLSGVGTLQWGVSARVQEMYATGDAAGFIIRDAAEDDAVGGQSAFDSREAPSDPPQLAITIG